MRRLVCSVIVVAATLAFVGCKKESTPGEKAGKALSAAEKTADSAKKDVEKGSGDLQKKLDNALKK